MHRTDISSKQKTKIVRRPGLTYTHAPTGKLNIVHTKQAMGFSRKQPCRGGGGPIFPKFNADPLWHIIILPLWQCILVTNPCDSYILPLWQNEKSAFYPCDRAILPLWQNIGPQPLTSYFTLVTAQKCVLLPLWHVNFQLLPLWHK